MEPPGDDLDYYHRGARVFPGTRSHDWRSAFFCRRRRM